MKGSKYLVFTIFFCVLIVGCRFRSLSLVDRLNKIDALFAVGDYAEAWKLLKKAEKKVHNPYEYLSLVRRALVLDKMEFSEKILKKAIKKYPNNLEIRAVYVHFLMRQNRFNEAMEFSYLLEGTKYGSLHAELRFKQNPNLTTQDYYSPSFLQAYIDIAHTTGNSAFIQNVALIEAMRGNMEVAFSFHPKKISFYDDTFFWALIAYYTHAYAVAYDDLQIGDISFEALSLSADTQRQLKQVDQVMQISKKIIEYFPKKAVVALYNNAQYFMSNKKYSEALELFTQLLDNFPDFIPAIIRYANISTGHIDMPYQPIFADVLEKRNIKTIVMENQANIIFPTKNDVEALFKKTFALLNLKNDSLGYNQLLVAHQKFEWEKVGSLSIKQKKADVELLLEQKLQEPNTYPEPIALFALYFYCKNDLIDEAANLHHQYSLQADYNMSPYEVELISYIALKQGHFDKAITLLESLYDNPSVKLSIASIFNLASVFEVAGKRDAAVALYNSLLTDKEIDDRTRSEVYYRRANCLYRLKQYETADISVRTCLEINPSHLEARLLKKELEKYRF